MILTLEFLKSVNACQEGISYAQENNRIGLDYDDTIQFCIETNQNLFADWLINLKTTEAYIRANGKVITMGTTYNVFNQFTGIHTEFETEELARLEILAISKQILDNYPVLVTQSISNENGDSTWSAVNITLPIQVI